MSMSVPPTRQTTTGSAPRRQGSVRVPAPNPSVDPPTPLKHHSTHPTRSAPPPTAPRHTHHPAAKPTADPPRSTSSRKPTTTTSRARTMDVSTAKNSVPVDTHRAKPNRSMTSGPTSAPAPPPPHRSHSSDYIDRDKNRKPQPPPKGPPTKKPTHVDVIDKLDYSGIGANMFHHDGPFDACAPSRNKNKTKAPMYAFDGDVAQQQADGTGKRLSPLAQATILAMKQSPGSSPYAAVGALNTADMQTFGKPPSPTYTSPKKKSAKKSALAEAWGIAEPEPFEEFSAGRQSAYEQATPVNGSLTSINNTSARTGMTTRADAYPEYPDSSRPQPARRPSRALPPPQPIQLYPEFPEGDDPVAMSQAPSAYGARPAGPKRSKSLIQRFRKMRDSPNAPPIADYDDDPRQAPDVRLVTQRAPPVPERPQGDSYMVIDSQRGARDKNLPMPPPSNVDYFESPHTHVGPGGATGVNRKGSLMQKVKGVMSR
ncbi:imidazoleglycerol phosphate synthase [Ceratobasidium sp. AG-Ba]|nr:imidazoleglycerol phosphate synthase [Ceratobasidium sp. AG-Ba]